MPWNVDPYSNAMTWVEPVVRAPVFDIMIDIETLGIKPGSVILNIGAVEFDPKTGEYGKTFYNAIDVADSQSYGMTITAETISWWMNQSAEARLSSFGGGYADLLCPVLKAFSDFVNGRKVWAHGPAMDVVLLEYAYRVTGVAIPWSYGAVRCTRTIYDLAGVSPDRSKGTHHNALDDATAQAAAVVEAYKRLSLEIAA